MTTETARKRPPFVLRTPEEIPLEFETAPLSGRLMALLIDLFFIIVVVFALAVIAFLAWAGGGGALLALSFLALFLARNFYFIFFEMHWSGRTPGKRAMGLRVIARDGGPLTSDLVVARNLTREFEVFLPVQLLFTSTPFLDLQSAWLRIITLAWIAALLLVPVVNAHRARLGDLLAGTLVVTARDSKLRRDLAAPAKRRKTKDRTPYRFTPAQLDVYGIFELQTLEKVLRGEGVDVDPQLVATICDKIKRKIDWPREEWDVDALEFLRDFYAAQRGRLEQDMLFGKRREKKRF